LAKLGFLSTLDMERALLVPALVLGTGAKALADAASIRETAAVNFMVGGNAVPWVV
jgi:hypothetical protein